MSRAAVAVPALLLLTAGVVALAVAAATGGDVSRGVTSEKPFLARAYANAAAAAYGRRVLVVHALPLADATAEVFESARVGGGWELHPASPPGATELESALSALASSAAEDWGADGRFEAATVERLARAAIAIVVVEDGTAVVADDRSAETAGLVPEASVPSLRVRAAEPVLRVVVAEGDPGGPRLEPARVREFQDGLWGGSVIVEAVEPGTFVFAWPREGARVTVYGADVVPVASGVSDLPPLVVLALPAGEMRVEVTFASTSGGPAWALGGAAAVVVGLIALLLALRPHPERDDAVAPDEEEPAA